MGTKCFYDRRRRSFLIIFHTLLLTLRCYAGTPTTIIMCNTPAAAPVTTSQQFISLYYPRPTYYYRTLFWYRYLTYRTALNGERSCRSTLLVLCITTNIYIYRILLKYSQTRNSTLSFTTIEICIFLFYFTCVVWLVRLFFPISRPCTPDVTVCTTTTTTTTMMSMIIIIIIKRRGSVGAPTVSRNFAGSFATAYNRASAGPTTERSRCSCCYRSTIAFTVCFLNIFPIFPVRPIDTPRVGRAIASFLHDRRRRTFCQWTSSHLKRTLIINAVNARAARVNG